MTYQIIVTKQGNTLVTIEGIEAMNALEAINRIEAQYKSKSVQLSGKGGAVQYHNWTGLEFTARQLDFILS